MNEFLQRIKEDARRTIEREAGTRAALIDPDGKLYEKSLVDENGEPYGDDVAAEDRRDLLCWVVQEHRDIDVETGFDNVVDRPVAQFSLKSLERVPKGGERWIVRVASSPSDDTLVSFALSGPPKGGKSIGFINLRLRELSQS
jgi:hypothetical protein